ncbi:polymorphic toxin type 5 domain-containing protein [Nocardia pseudobrasiliensis]|uniref:Uncharacterized protein n=1 Tax=Nocardia pseudobrasiliensis TaxID=45979 RepID=A0A370IBR5_9NOCA|nr:polymorphic toxin type 5 domain-containing protein [Nocardia pseudobrasiliensis]RDI68168.1 hypothetical protein DFR76_102569 [Nocardia pseudobrasiliensis]
MTSTISVTFSGPSTLDDPQAVETTVRGAISQAVLSCQDEGMSRDPGHPATLAELAAGGLPREREMLVLGDILRIGPTATSPVLSIGHDVPQWVKAGGYLEVETGDPVRAVNWGRYLFGERGFAVLTSAEHPGRLIVRALTTPLRAKDFGGFVPAVSHEPGHAGAAATAPASGATLLTDASLQPLLVSTAEGVRLYRRYSAQGPGDWAGENIERGLTRAGNAGALNPADVQEVLRAVTSEHADDASIAHLLVALDRSLFAAMGVADRRRYLLALLRMAERAASGVDGEQLATAMVELIASCHSASELRALLEPLAADGSLLKLFSQFDKPTFRLLLAVGEHLKADPVDTGELMDMLVYQLKHPMSALEVIEFVGTAYDWLRGTVSSLGDLPLLPVELGGSLPKLYELYVLVCRATGIVPVPIPGVIAVAGPSDPEALAKVRALLASAGTTGRTALAGLKFIEAMAGVPGEIGSALARRCAYVVLLEILAAFVTAVPELKAAELAERIAAQARLFEALAASMKLKEAGEVGRLMWLLPKSSADDVLRLLAKAPKRARTLTRYLSASAEAEESGKRLLTALRIARTMEETLGPASELAEDLLRGAHRIIESVSAAPAWSGDAVQAVLRQVPEAELADLLRIAGRLTVDQCAAFSPAEFARVARAHRALEFVVEAGAHALAPTARAFGTNTSRYEHFLARVAAARRRLGAQEYHELLERLAAGSTEGFDDSDWLSEITGSVEKTLSSTARPTIPASALGDIGVISSKDGFRRAVARVLRDDPGHPLRFLLDENGSLRSTTGDFAHWLENPEITEAGHLTSAKSLGEAGGDQLVVMSTYRNRLASSTIEHPSRGGFMSIDTALEIRGIPVDPETVVDWVSKGLLDPLEFDRARRVRYRPVSEQPLPASVRVEEPLIRIHTDELPIEEIEESGESLRQLRKEPDK